MRRETRPPRPDWQARVERFGFDFHTLDGAPYWVEDGCFRFEAEEIDRIEAAGTELHAMCLQAVERICTRGEFDRVGLGEQAARLAEASWRRRDPGLLGRMDLAYDGTGEPVLLEYNADTPTSLLEASVIQWYWLEDTGAGADQFNRIHEALVARWPSVAQRDAPVHFTGALESHEDYGNLAYLRETCNEAGFETRLLDITDIGLQPTGFVDLDDKIIRQLDKLYPWEWLLAEDFGAAIARNEIRWIEPAWKQVLSNKRLLPLLWELFPGHPNLVPAAVDPARLRGPVARKPQFGREGEQISLHPEARALSAHRNFVLQEQVPLFRSEHGHALLGLWIVGEEAVGLGLREDDDAVTRDTSRFVPHCFD
jgi:glutathionylspermidine synthase